MDQAFTSASSLTRVNSLLAVCSDLRKQENSSLVGEAVVQGRGQRDADLGDPWLLWASFGVLLTILGSSLIFRFLWLKISQITEKTFFQATQINEVSKALLSHFANSIAVEGYQWKGMVKSRQGISIAFEKLGLVLKSNGRTLLEGVTGSFPKGEMVAIMGPSGCGKTTFMNALCGKANYGKITGEVRINGELCSVRSLKPVIGFVPQDDIVHETLTVAEQIRYSAQLRNDTKIKRAQIGNIVADILHVLQIGHIQNSVVGGVEERGISGGQRKRVNIGLELAACPLLLFLDEPTSGLDSTSAFMIINSLKKMTDLGMTVIMVIHQPRYSLFTLFDQVLLLGKGGRTVYLGPSKETVHYFESYGFKSPAEDNPADWLMDVISGEVASSAMPDFTPDQLFDLWEMRGAAHSQYGHSVRYVNPQQQPLPGRNGFLPGSTTDFKSNEPMAVEGRPRITQFMVDLDRAVAATTQALARSAEVDAARQRHGPAVPAFAEVGSLRTALSNEPAARIRGDRLTVKRCLEEEWEKIDKDGSDTLDAKELQLLLDSCGCRGIEMDVIEELLASMKADHAPAGKPSFSRQQLTGAVRSLHNTAPESVVVSRSEVEDFLLGRLAQHHKANGMSAAVTSPEWQHSDSECEVQFERSSRSDSSNDSSNDGSSDGSESSNSNDGGQSDGTKRRALRKLSRTLPGLSQQFLVILHRRQVQVWRNWKKRLTDLALVAFVAVALGLKAHNDVTRLTNILMAQTALALLICASSLSVFADRPILLREASSNVSLISLFSARVVVGASDWITQAIVYVVIYWRLAHVDKEGNAIEFSLFFWPVLLVAWVATGFSYLISVSLPANNAFTASVMLMMSLCSILGEVELVANSLSSGGFMAAFVALSITRWSVPMVFNQWLYFRGGLPPMPYPPDCAGFTDIDEAVRQQADRNLTTYFTERSLAQYTERISSVFNDTEWIVVELGFYWASAVVLLFYGVALHCVALLILHRRSAT